MASRSLPLALGGATVLFAALTACSPQQQETPTVNNNASQPASGLSCSKDTLKTKTPGKLTIGTDDPAYEPWFKQNKPENGEGFESAVAYAVADRLGYGQSDVTWQRVTFNNAIAPGPKPYDIDINQFSITDERKKAVDFSSPYYLVRQTVIAVKDSKIAKAKSIADLEDAKLGAQVGTTSLQAINLLIKPKAKPQVYNSNDDAKKALQNGQIDGLVVDLPTAFFMTSAELKDGVLVGQLSQVGVPEQFGIVLDKNSPLTGCVTQAVDQLRGSGTLTNLEKQWLSQAAGAPELT